MTIGTPTLDKAPGDLALAPGQTVTFAQTITEQMLDAYAAFSGDFNPLHMDDRFAQRAGFRGRIAHGMIACSCLSQLIGMRLPGPGALWASQNFRWLAPVFIGDRIEFTLQVSAVSPGTGTVTLSARVVNQNGRAVMEGDGVVKLLEPRASRREGPRGEHCALITGAGHGAGAAIAEALANQAVKVALLCSGQSLDADQACESIRAAGAQAIAVQADPLEPASISDALRRVEDTFGTSVDILVNEAQLAAIPTPIQDLSWPAIQHQLDLDLRAAFELSQAVLPGMLRRGGGSIVHIGSTLNWNVPPLHWTAFCIAKAALKALTHSLAVELGPKGIRVNLVSPGLPETGLPEAVTERFRKLQAMQTPLRRLASASDIAASVAFLCSDHSEFITGADIPVCGGQVM